ncbi:hypothetical protein Agub_g14743, partial [Astrephomene gubernaculifera]
MLGCVGHSHNSLSVGMLLKPQVGPSGLAGKPRTVLQPIRLQSRITTSSVWRRPQQFGGIQQQSSLGRVACKAAPQPGPPPIAPNVDPNIKLKKRFWTVLDVVAIFGSVGGALAAILNLFPGTYMLFLPLVLPVVSLLSALQREGLIAEDNRRAYDTLRLSLSRDSSSLLADARGALEEVRVELRGQNTTAARLATIEARLSSLEGSILSAGRSAREAAAGLTLLPERLQSEQRGALEGLLVGVRAELRRAAEALANSETSALARLDARLAAVEGSLSGLEVSQSEGLRRLSMSLNSALADAEATLQSGVRNEVARSMEPVRRLPQMLAAALPPALAAAEAVEASSGGGGGGGNGVLGMGAAAGVGKGGVGAAGMPVVAVSAEQLQALLGQEVEVAVGRILDYQADAFGRLTAVRPAPMDEEQWSALGRRLSRLERLVEGVPAGTEASLVQGGQLAAAVAAVVREALAEQLAEARADVAAAAAREAEGVRNDVLAAQTVLRESLDGLTAALQPVVLGVTELQVAVAEVAEVQRQQLAAAAEVAPPPPAVLDIGGDGDGDASNVPPPPPLQQQPLPPAELARLLDGVTAVARLLRDVDAKMDGVTTAVALLPEQLAAAAAAAPPPSEAAVAEAPELPPAVASATAAEAAAAAEAARQQQLELQAAVAGMREALASLATQVSEMASSSHATAAQTAATSAAIPVTLAEMPSAAAADDSSSSSSDAGVNSNRFAEILAFEAGLTAEAEVVGGAGGGSGAGSAAAPSAATSRQEAYDMMLQLAEARRRSAGSPAAAAAAAEARGSSSSSSRGGGGGDVAEAGHIQIEGLPPFEQGGMEELPPLPPTQEEVEEEQRRQQQQQQQQDRKQQQEQEQEWGAPGQHEQHPQQFQFPAPQQEYPLQVQQEQQPLYPPPPPPLQQQQEQQGPYPPPSAYSSAALPPSPSPPSLPYNDVGVVYTGGGVDGASMDAALPYTERMYGSPGLSYNWQQQQVRQEQQQPASSPTPPPSPFPQQQQEQQSWSETMQASSSSPQPFLQQQPQQQQQQQEQQSMGAPAPAAVPPSQYGYPHHPPPSSSPQPPLPPPSYIWSPAAAVQPPPVWPATSVTGQPNAAAGPLSAPPTSASTPLPSQPPPLPPQAAAAAAATPPQPATVVPSMSPLPAASDYLPRSLEGLSPNEMIGEGLRLLRLGREETRKGEDYGLADTLVQAAIAAFSAASAAAPQDAKAYGNLGNALLARGELKAAYLEALRSGPPPASLPEAEAQRAAEAAMTGEANALLTQAGVMFMKVLEMEGWSSRALVNWGRALVIRADLLAASPEGMAASAAVVAGGGGAGGGLGSSSSSPVLAAVAQLYTSAINKFEGVLEGEPDMVPAKYRCALAMAGLSRTKPPASRESLALLSDAINYLRDVL